MKVVRYSLIAGAVMALAPPAQAVDLVGVRDMALRNDPQLRAAALRREAGEENKYIAWANFLPTLDGSARVSYGDNEVDIADQRISETDIDDENLRLELRQTLYNQSNYEELQRGRAQASRAEADYLIAYQDFLLRVAERYFAVLTAQDSLRFALAEEAALQRQFEQADQRFEVGLAAVTDVHEARASYDNARARTILARNQLEDAQEALRELTGQHFENYRPLANELPLEAPLPENPQDWVDFAIELRPELIASRFTAETAEADMELARAGYFPTLELIASYNRFTDNEFPLRNDQQDVIGVVPFENSDSQVQLQLNVPIFRGGRVTTRTRQARYLMSAAYEDVEAQQRAAVRAAENAYRDVMAGIQEVEAFRQALVSAQSALDATNSGFEVGTRTIVDVLLAEQRYYQAQRDYSNARHDYILDHLRLRRSAGLLAGEDLNTVNRLLQ